MTWPWARWVWAATLAMALALIPGAAAWAHGRFPVPNGLVFHPTDPAVMVVRSTRGLIATTDGGASWAWMCLEVVEVSTFGQQDPALALMGDGRLVAASGLRGVIRSDPAWCVWAETELSEERRYFVIDQAKHPTLPDTTFVVTSSGTPTVNLVFRSDDGGATWQPTNDGIEAVFFESITIAPSTPDVIYLSAITPDLATREGRLYYSTNGGESWDFTSIPLLEGEHKPVVSGVDPTDPSRVFVTVLHNDFQLEPPEERLLLSENGGASLTEVLSAPHLRAFAISGDGTRAWAGDDAAGGFWRSNNGGASFELVDAVTQVHCLEWHDGKLWRCANHFREGFAVATSEDGGDSFTPFFRFTDVGRMVACPGDAVPGDTLLAICHPYIVCDGLPELGLCPNLVAPQVDCGPVQEGCEAPDGGPQGDASIDSGLPGATPGRASGCGCATVAYMSHGWMSWAWMLVGLWLWRCRRGRLTCSKSSTR
jgi:hypothetical protein